MWWIYALAFGLTLTNSVIAVWLITRENGPTDFGPFGRRPQRGPEPPRFSDDRGPVKYCSQVHRRVRKA